SELPDILIVCVIALAVVLPVLAFGGLNEIECDDENTKSTGKLARTRSANRQLHASRAAESDSSTGSHRVDAYWAQIVSSAMVSGTPIKAPGMPQISVQKNTANSTTNGEIASEAPASSGSR